MKIEEKNGNLIIVDFNEFEAYKIAVQIEKEGIEFYKKLLGNTPQGRVNEIINFLVTEEQKHLKTFESLLLRLREDKEELWEEDDVLGSMDYGIFKPYKNIEDLDKFLTDPKKAIKLGIIIEERSIKFYEICRQEVSNPLTKEEIQKIIQEEYRHKQLLEDIAKGDAK
ncbi:MAG: ferritin family protein [Candidatus Omnitrophica bacterium]|nr:ferritin family protein [Candidatus Omnitrophota bacterium]